MNFDSVIALLAIDHPQRCSIRCLDTIVFNNRCIYWYFTSKNGNITKKKNEKSTPDAILNRFVRFSLANPNNVNKYVAIVLNRDGNRKILNEEMLNDALNNAINNENLDNYCFLQVYLRPFGGVDNIYVGKYQYYDNNEIIQYFVKSGGVNSLIVETDHPQVCPQMQSILIEIVKSVQYSQNERFVTELQIECILDDNSHIWLSNILGLTLSDKLTTVNYNDIANSSRNNSATVKSEQSLIHESRKVSSAATGQLISREGKTYKSSLGPDELPGLRTWSIVAVSPTGQCKWTINLEEYTSTLVSDADLVPLQELRNQRASTRHTVSRASPSLCLLLHRGMEDLLLGKTLISSGKEFSEVWLKLVSDSSTSLSATRQISEVNVCGNCFAILCKLDSLLGSALVDGSNSNGSNEFALASQTQTPISHNSRPQSQTITASNGLVDEEDAVASEELRPKSDPLVNRSHKSTQKKRGVKNADLTSGSVKNAGQRGNGNGGEYSQMIPVTVRDSYNAFEKMESPLPSNDNDSNRNSNLAHSTDETTATNTITINNNDTPTKGGGEELHDKKTKQNQLRDGSSNSNNKVAINGKSNLKKKLSNKITTAAGVYGDNSRKRREKGGEKPSLPPPDLAALMAQFAMEKERIRRDQLPPTATSTATGTGAEEGGEELPDDVTENPPNHHHHSTAAGAGAGRGKRNKINAGHSKKSEIAQRPRVPLGSWDDAPPLPSNGPHADSSSNSSSYRSPSDNIAWPTSPSPSEVSAVSRSTLISASEAQFVLRQTERRGRGGDKGRQVAANYSTNDESTLLPYSTSLGGLLSTDHEHALETQIASLLQQLQQKDDLIESTDKELRKRNKEIETQRLHWKEEIRAIKENYETEILRLKESHALTLAAVSASASQPLTSENANASSSASSHNNANAASLSTSNQQLFSQIDIMREELRHQQEKFSADRKQLQAQFTSKSEAREKQVRGELTSLREQLREHEDTITAMTDELTAVTAKSEGLLKMCRQLEQSRLEAVESSNKLRAELRGMQQAVTASYRLEASQGAGVGVDADTAIRINEAKLGAKERQLSNKVEFLLAQLSAEQSVTEELRASLSTSQGRIDELKEECRERLREADAAKFAAVEEAERRVESQYESRMNELISLQAKIALLQGQLQESFQESAVTKQREEASKLAASKATASITSLRVENETLRSQINEMKEERERNNTREVSKQSQDALLRRLDNERMYLKSQLASEIAHKKDVQKELTQCQKQLVETQRQWQEDVDALKEVNNADIQEASRNEQRLQESNIQLDAENLRLQAVNKELKDAFTKTRDLLRLEQCSLETSRSENSSLLEEMKNLQEEIQELQNNERSGVMLHQQQMKAVAMTMEELEQKRVKEVSRLKDDLSSQFMLQSTLQKDSLNLRLKAEEERKDGIKKMGVLAIFEWTVKYRRNRLFSMFRRWSSICMLVNAADQFRETLHSTVMRTKAESASEHQKSLETLQSVLKNEAELKLAEERAGSQIRLQQDLEQLAKEKDAVIAQLQSEMKRLLDAKDADWVAEIRRIQKVHEQEVQKLSILHDLKMTESLNQMTLKSESAAAVELQKAESRQLAAIQENDRKWLSRLQAKEVELDFEHNQSLQGLAQQHRKELDEAAKENIQKILLTKQQKEKELSDKLIQWQVDKEGEKRLLLEEAKVRLEDKVQEITKLHTENISALRLQLQEESEARLRKLRELWTEETTVKLKQKADEVTESLNQTLVQVQSEFESERQRAIKLEAAKWQQAAKETQRRFEADLKLAKRQGWEDHEVLAKEEVARLTASHESAMQQLLGRHHSEVSEAAKTHAETLNTLKIEFEVEKQEVMQQVEKDVKTKKDAEWSLLLQDKLAHCEEAVRSEWERKLQKETDRLERFKEDISRQSQHQAQERKELLERIDRQEDLSRRMEALNHAEIEQVKREAEGEKDKLRFRCEKAKEAALSELKASHEALLESRERQWKEDMIHSLQRERENIQKETEIQLLQLQEESEKLVAGLEQALQDLSKEKGSLSAQLDSTTSKLEEIEDSHYDLEQLYKKLQLTHSLQRWQSTVSSTQLKERFKHSLLTLEKENEEALAKCSTQGNTRNKQLTNAITQLVLVINETEDTRKKIHSILRTHKSDFLNEKRTQIRLLERELERIGEEREAFESQKDKLDDEVNELQSQVHDIEEQIREHNRDSAVQNGRVNAAHARKKRRLDNEIERLFDLMEQKRDQITALEDKLSEKQKERDDKEADMIDLERLLVQVLIEQQRLVLTQVDDSKCIDERCRLITQISGVSYPALTASVSAGTATSSSSRNDEVVTIDIEKLRILAEKEKDRRENKS